MNNIKKFFSFTKLLWIGGIIGLIQMISDTPVYFWDIMNYMGLYAAVTLFLIHRDKPPKKQFLDIFLFFMGIDLSCILFVINKYSFFSGIDNITAFLFLIFVLTARGILMAVWGFLTVKCRNKGYKGLYFIMLIPFFALIFWNLQRILSRHGHILNGNIKQQII